MKQFLMPLWEVLEILIIAIVSIFLIYHFIAQPFEVDGASMQPTFVSGSSWYDSEFVLVDEVSYHFESPQRGQIIVFHDPLDPSQFFIKRIIGLPGDVVSLSGGNVYINGVLLKEPYLAPGTMTTGPQAVYPKLGPDQYFVMGDNRVESFDSRSWGPVDSSAIVGVVRIGLKFWPPSLSYE